MKPVLQWLIWGAFGVMGLTIVFVKTGSKGGPSGGEQTAMIAQSTSQGAATIAAALEGG